MACFAGALASGADRAMPSEMDKAPADNSPCRRNFRRRIGGINSNLQTEDVGVASIEVYSLREFNAIKERKTLKFGEGSGIPRVFQHSELLLARPLDNIQWHLRFR